MIIKFYRIIWGFLRVRFYGSTKERVLAACANNGISLWNTRLTDKGIESCILIRDFRVLRKILPKSARVHILKKRGIPFITARYSKRYGIAVGAVLFFALLQLLSSYIWVIDINGNRRLSEAEILNACRNIGIETGIKKKSIYPKGKRESLILQLEDIAWAGINIEGSRLTVNITETKEKVQESSFSNLKAEKDGIITKIDIISGTAVVKVGQAVKKGDLLVSGIVETAEGNRFVNSKGNIIAKVKEETVLREKFTQTVNVPTADIHKRYVIDCMGLKIPLYLGSEKGEFTAKKSQNTLALFGSRLPITLYKKSFILHKSKEVTFSFETLSERLEQRLQSEMESKENFKVTERIFQKTESEVILKAVTEGVENIAYSDILLINTGN